MHQVKTRHSQVFKLEMLYFWVCHFALSIGFFKFQAKRRVYDGEVPQEGFKLHVPWISFLHCTFSMFIDHFLSKF